MKFKTSTHQLIDKRVKELLQPEIRVGETYRFNTIYGLIERPVLDIQGDVLTYTKNGKICTCSLNTFRRLFAEHGVKSIEST